MCDISGGIIYFSTFWNYEFQTKNSQRFQIYFLPKQQSRNLLQRRRFIKLMIHYTEGVLGLFIFMGELLYFSFVFTNYFFGYRLF